ncbi:MAG TPA: PQQ-binding-like beta-propeller repeat protein [Gammaproteobacteria bacterium]
MFRSVLVLAGLCVAGAAAAQSSASSPLYVSEFHCESTPPLRDSSPHRWIGWGPTVTNTRFQPEEAGGITVDDIPKLKLAWAYGLPQEQQPRGQPSVLGGRLFVGSQAGAVYALDAKTGCTHWQFFPVAGLRSATSVGPHRFADGREGFAVYFVDSQGYVYALDADTGEEIWRTRVEDHPRLRGTGALTLYEGRLYVPMTGINEAMSGASPEYACCTFRGSLTAVDAATGEIVWKTYTIPEPKRRGTSSAGQPLWGPAGVGIWNAPTIDAKRGLIYSGTGPAYADDGATPPTTDAVVAFDLETGEIRWTNQFTRDVWLLGCDENADANPNCPTEQGPDLDFSASPILTTTSEGKDVIVIPQKSGMVWGLDPDNEGKTLWSYRAGPGGPVGGVWGSAVEGDRMYVAVGGYNNEETGGIHAIDIRTGERIWYTPPQPLLCSPPGPRCSATQAAAVTAVPGAVFSGSADGGLRAYDGETGEVIWTFDANRSFETVNGVAATGASFDGPGPVVAGGMLYVLSGDAGFVGRPGNVLLAFSVEE